jgi:hypothetical protein
MTPEPNAGTGVNPPARSDRVNKTAFVLMIFGGFLLVFIVGVLVGGVQWWLLTQYKQERSAPGQPARVQQPSQPSQQGPTTADDASKALSQRVATASSAERQPVAEALALAESTYPKDYRFPFEHAKLVVAGNVHHHAFGLLFTAAQRAIASGKADEFLVDVKKEADGAFYRCSRGHPEWKTLEDSLKNKDQSLLQTQMVKMHRDVIGGADDLAEGMVMDH